VRRLADWFILAVWVLCCGLTIDVAIFSPVWATPMIPLFAGAGLGWYWRGRKL
jgi:hypothetical protein